jgi:restriction endonuclease S subunit
MKKVRVSAMAGSLSMKSPPHHWLRITVGKTGEVQVGRQLTPEFKKGLRPVPYIRAANITTEGLDLTEVLEMDFGEGEQQKYMLVDGDIILAEASGSAQHVGRCAVWRNEIPGCCFQNTVIRYRSRVTTPEFAQIVFQFYAETGEFGRVARGIGILHLGGKRFAQMPFPVPPREEQSRIARRVDAIRKRLSRVRDRLVATLPKVNAHFKNAQAELLNLYRLYPSVYGSSGKPIVGDNSELHTVSLGDVCDAINGRAFKSSQWKSTGMPIIRIQNLKDPDAPFNYFKGKLDPRHTVKKGDLLFAWSGTPETSFGAFVWARGTSALNQHIFKIEHRPNLVDKNYLYHTLKGLHEWFVSIARGGGGLGHLSKAEFLQTQLYLPDLSEQRRIASQLTELNAWRDREHAVISKSIERTRDLTLLVLRRAVTGELVAREPGSQRVDIDSLERNSGKQKKLSSNIRPTPEKLKFVTKVIRPLNAVLAEKGPLDAQELLENAGYSIVGTEEISRFYAELTNGIQNGSIVSFSDPKSGRRLLKAHNQ